MLEEPLPNEGRLREEVVERVTTVVEDVVVEKATEVLAAKVVVRVEVCWNVVSPEPGAGPEQSSPLGQQPIIPFDPMTQ